jgi:hypothetical protein
LRPASRAAGVGAQPEDLRLGVLVGRDELELTGALDQRDPDRPGTAQRHHRAVATVGDRLDGWLATPVDLSPILDPPRVERDIAASPRRIVGHLVH